MAAHIECSVEALFATHVYILLAHNRMMDGHAYVTHHSELLV